MKASNFELNQSPENPTRIRASVEIRYRGFFARSERLWFEFEDIFAGRISERGDPWLLALLPLAFTLGEPIEIDLPVRPDYIDGVEQVMSIWSHWYPQFKPVRLSAPLESELPVRPDRRIGLYFSGGVDSTYSVLHHDENEPAGIDDLIFLRGFDIHLQNEPGLEEAQTRVARTAERLGKRLVVVSTNARNTRLKEANWERLAHGPVLCAAGLLLETVYHELLIGSAWPADLNRPLGSHPYVYPHFSTSNTRVTLYAPDVRRSSKVELISQHPDLLHELRVCWESGQGGNCGRCAKCLYTMAALEVFGALKNTTAFPSSEIDHSLLQSAYVGRKSYYFEDIRDRAMERGRNDIAESMNASISMSARLSRILNMDRVLPVFVRLRFNPRLRRITDPVRPALWRFLRRVVRFVSARTASED